MNVSKGRRTLWRWLAVACLIVVLGASVSGVRGQNGNIEMSPVSGDADNPRRHFRLRNPAQLSPERATELYDIVKPALLNGYTRSRLDFAEAYQSWKRFNNSPYLSMTHGNHYLNNYANDIGAAYGRFEAAAKLPVGTVIAKDSFAATSTGGILLGPLFVMEKMPEGFNYVSGDWKYTLVLPDGSVLGETNGKGSAKVKYCIDCHLAVEHQDHLYFMPKPYRQGTQ